MKLNSKRSAVAEWLVIAAVLFMKTALTQPLYEQLLWLSGSYYISKAVLAAAVAAAVVAVALTLMLKNADSFGSWAKVLIILIVAEPMLLSGTVSLFHAVAVLITVIWVAVCLKVENRIIAAAVSVVATAAMSFIMPCSVFSLIPLGILVLLITTKNDTLSVIFTLIGSAASVAASVIGVQFSEAELRTHFGLNGIFEQYGGNESHPLSFEGLNAVMNFEQASKAAFASLPVVIFAACIVYGLIRYSDAQEMKKTGRKPAAIKKIIPVALIVLPYVISAFGSIICNGNGALTVFNFAPLVIILALAKAGNRAVIDSLEKVSAFAKAHPVISVIAIVWVASYTMAFADNGKIFTYATQFFQ